MFGISFSEFIIIAIALFLIVGPKRMASSAYKIGAWLRVVKTEFFHLKQTHLQDIDMSSFYETKTELNKSLRDMADAALQNPVPQNPIKKDT